MRLPIGSKPAAAFILAFSLAAIPVAAGEAAAPAAPAVPGAPAAVPAPAQGKTSAPGPEVAQAAVNRAQRLKARPPAPLKHLSFSAREGFALRMISGQEVSAEIRNGAGRTLAFTSRTLEAGDWTLKPRNLAPGLYTVLLRTGPNLRALRMKIEDAERGEGKPEWVVEKAADSGSMRAPEAPARGAMLTE
jgi:hypothetical protein